MLVARLKDSEVRAKDLQRQVRRLMSWCCNQSDRRGRRLVNGRGGRRQPCVRGVPVAAGEQRHVRQRGGGLEDGTFASTVVSNSDDKMEPFYARTVREEDVLSDFFSEVAQGVESLQGEGGLCCAQRQGQESDARAPETRPRERCRGGRSKRRRRPGGRPVLLEGREKFEVARPARSGLCQATECLDTTAFEALGRRLRFHREVIRRRRGEGGFGE